VTWEGGNEHLEQDYLRTAKFGALLDMTEKTEETGKRAAEGGQLEERDTSN